MNARIVLAEGRAFGRLSGSRAQSDCMLEVELHAHTDMDPLDRIPHSTGDLIDPGGIEKTDVGQAHGKPPVG